LRSQWSYDAKSQDDFILFIG